jgi:prefoldin subunit 5
VATRFLLNKVAAQALGLLKREHLRQLALDAKEKMRKSWRPSAFAAIVGEYCDVLRGRLQQTNAHVGEIQKMIVGVQSGFAQEQGWSLAPPIPFSLDSYLTEIDRLNDAAKAQFGTFTVLTHGKWGLIERFLESIVAKSRDLLVAAERDLEAWAGSLLPPIESQVREQRGQLSRRADAVQKIRDAQDSLEGRIGELEGALASVTGRLESLRERFEAVRRRANEAAEDFAESQEARDDDGLAAASRQRVAA